MAYSKTCPITHFKNAGITRVIIKNSPNTDPYGISIVRDGHMHRHRHRRIKWTQKLESTQ